MSTLPNNLISNNEALKMINFHLRSNYPTESISGHLEWADFKNYLEYIENKCRDIDVSISGIEYFFARYDGTELKGHGKQRTIVMYPTYKDSAGHHIPFDPTLSTSPDDIVTLKMLNDRKSAVSDPGILDGGNAAYNRSQMSPPRPPGI